MNILLIFFAIPIAVIIISIALQKILKCPPLVAAIIFAIFLVVTFIISNLSFLVAAIVYGIISYITAVITCLVCRFLRNCNRENNCWSCCCDKDNDSCRNCNRENNRDNQLLTINSSCSKNSNGDLLRISSNGCNGVTNDLLTVRTNCNNNDNNNCCNSCNNRCCCSNNNNFVNGTITLAENGEPINNSCNCDNSGRVSARINVIPNDNTNGRTGCLCGSYRRR